MHDTAKAAEQRVNVLRGSAPTADNHRKTHCRKGHDYSPENTRIYRGSRYCRTCERERLAARYPGYNPWAGRARIRKRGRGWKAREET